METRCSWRERSPDVGEGGGDGLNVVCLGMWAGVPEGAYLVSLGRRGKGDSRVRMTSYGRQGRGGGALIL